MLTTAFNSVLIIECSRHDTTVPGNAFRPANFILCFWLCPNADIPGVAMQTLYLTE